MGRDGICTPRYFLALYWMDSAFVFILLSYFFRSKSSSLVVGQYPSNTQERGHAISTGRYTIFILGNIHPTRKKIPRSTWNTNTVFAAKRYSGFIWLKNWFESPTGCLSSTVQTTSQLGPEQDSGWTSWEMSNTLVCRFASEQGLKKILSESASAAMEHLQSALDTLKPNDLFQNPETWPSCSSLRWPVSLANSPEADDSAKTARLECTWNDLCGRARRLFPHRVLALQKHLEALRSVAKLPDNRRNNTQHT